MFLILSTIAASIHVSIMKNKLLKILKSKDDIISGELLCEELGVSRVSVWKHIKKLQESGYEIESSSKGYRFISAPDALYPWEFPDRESTIHYFEEIPSTMETAKELARKGCPSFTVVIAGRQIKGRGRLKRTWHSDNGGLYFTLVVRPKIPPSMMSRISFAASLNLARTLREDYGVDAMVKWPNDILVNEKKLSGMLCEMEVESDMVSFLNIGIGLNVNNDPKEKEPNSVSLKELLGREVPRKEVLCGFLDRLEKELSKDNLDHIIPEWKKYTLTLNRHVRIVTTNAELEGKAVDVDDSGALLLEQADKSIKKVFYGDCFHNE
ncbi:biotin--[acetyl-CoA-carboxylase] ligase [bacterium]|nr:biotin--[acetyl-CoA-carboxylase] ligase [bacterium]